ncbi:MAG TPA: hypothetical protein VFT22_21820 [Kofleriaceae bacterium]|nr:hypothetical protein [Kofleriaceae bacterium]
MTRKPMGSRTSLPPEQCFNDCERALEFRLVRSLEQTHHTLELGRSIG